MINWSVVPHQLQHLTSLKKLERGLFTFILYILYVYLILMFYLPFEFTNELEQKKEEDDSLPKLIANSFSCC
jgi:penicillin-binding protein-related factor A (putative recombinase)